MNNLAYSTQNVEKVSANIEEILRKDFESSSPLLYAVTENDAPKGNMVSTFGKALSVALFGGKEKLLFSIQFEIQSPRPVSVLMMVSRAGLAGSHVGSVIFSTPISKTVSGVVNMEGPKTFGSSKFIGHDETAKKLNGNKELLKLTEKFARVKSDVGGGMKMERYVNLEPSENGSILTIATLPRAYSMGLKATTDAKDFIEIAQLIEKLS